MLQFQEETPRSSVPGSVDAPFARLREDRLWQHAPLQRFRVLEGIRRPESEVGRFVERQLERWAGHDRTLVMTVPAPPVEPETLLEVVGRSPGVFWGPAEGDQWGEPGDGTAYAGAGAAYTIQVTGQDRFQQLRRQAERLWQRLVVATYGSGSLTSGPVSLPRLFGGLAFSVGAAGEEPWREFGDGGFTLPRFLYRRDGRGASLSLAVDGGEISGRAERVAWRVELGRVLAELARRGSVAPRWTEDRGSVLKVHQPSRTRWEDEVEAIRGAIARGDFSKIVAAQRSRVDLNLPLETATVLRRLPRSGVTRFAFRREHSTFLGATPERLIARRGRHIETEALAGSIERGDQRAARLMASGKDRYEHTLVVDEIVSRLQPLCGRLSLPAVPGIRELRDVLHLRTPITGILASPRHVLDLVEALHPTPAVGGVPAAAAMRWISEHESGGRGWYASPIGWFDASGNGEFAVALRSCVLRGSEAHLYAGAGIVADSDPRLEYHETELKRQALLTALGA